MELERKERLHLAMPPKTKQLLDDLQARTGAGSMTEVIRRALALLDVVSAEQENGGGLVIHGQGGKQTKIRII